MIVRYIPADPAGNLTAIVLSPVAPQARAAVAARMMARCPEGFEQVGFAEEDSLTGEFPRLCMMGGEFCGNAARAFACYAAGVRGRGETRLSVAISGARNPVPVEIEPASGRAYAQMPLPCALDRLCADGRDIPLVRMEVTCSKGTYIRTLCHDIGQALGCGGCMATLRRTMAAGYTLDESHTLEQVQAQGEALLRPVDTLFRQAVGMTP